MTVLCYGSSGGGLLCNWNDDAGCFDNIAPYDSRTASIISGTNNIKVDGIDKYTKYNTYLNWLFNAAKGTIWVKVKFSEIPSGSDSNEFFEVFKDWNTCIRLMLDQYGKIHANFRGNGGTQWVNTPANTISVNTWYYIGYSWDCANNKHVITASQVYSSGDTMETAETIDWGSNTPTNLCVGTDMCPYSDGYAQIGTVWIGDGYKMAFMVGDNAYMYHTINVVARLIALQQQQLLPPIA